MSWTDDGMDCDGCRREIAWTGGGHVAHAVMRSDGDTLHYHESCWLTGWYSGVEPKGEWPIHEAPEPAFDSTSINPFEIKYEMTTNLEPESDPVNSPAHYRWLPNGVEVIDITETLNFTMGNAVKYILRADHKGKPIEDLKKAAWYIQRELDRRARDNGNNA